MRLTRSMTPVRRRLPALALGLGAVTLVATPAAAVPAGGHPAGPATGVASATVRPSAARAARLDAGAGHGAGPVRAGHRHLRW